MRAAPLLPFVFLATVLAGCVDGGGDGEHEGTTCVAESTPAAKVANSWAYSGEELRDGNGTMQVRVEDRDDSGTVTGHVVEAGADWHVEFTNFSATRPFHDGGVAFHLTEHGDSGVGDATIPRVRMLCAGWGAVRLTLDGQAVAVPGGAEAFAGHFMVASTGVRDDATGRITDRDGSADYSPSRPGNAARQSDDLEFWIKVSADEAGNATATNVSGTANSPVYNMSHGFPVLAAGANISVAVTGRGATPGPLLGQLEFTLRDAGGGELASTTLGGPGQVMEGGIHAPADRPGMYALQVTGSAVQVAYEAEITVERAGGFLLVFFWEEGEQAFE